MCGIAGILHADRSRPVDPETLVAMAAMLVYIAFRFETIYGVGATVAIVHDVLVTLGLFGAAGYEISLNVIAAFLTLVGYSVNDTIVVFDRIRENRRAIRAVSLYDVINVSINQTLRRTILTSLLTFVAVVPLFLIGGEALRPFAFVMLVGIVVGTYSTLGIASPIVLWWKQMRLHGTVAAPRPSKPAMPRLEHAVRNACRPGYPLLAGSRPRTSQQSPMDRP